MTPNSVPASESRATGRAPDCFPTTHWTVLLAVGEPDARSAAAASEILCETYWRPIYAYLRRQGIPPADAQDLTQEFFARVVAKNYLARLRHREGKFRSFLLTFLRRFLSDERDRARAQKRGGGQMLISLDEWAAEERFAPDLGLLSPDRAFDRRWASALLERAQERLRQLCLAEGKVALFETWLELQSDRLFSPADAAARLRLPGNTLRSHTHRLRQRYRQLLREEITRTVAGPGEVDEEIRYLLAVMAE